MRQLKLKRLILMLAITSVSACVSLSCQDDTAPQNNGAERVEEGLPATVKMKVVPDDMGLLTRSIANDEAANYCDNLWIGLYSKTTGKRLGYYYTTDVEQTKEATGTEYTVSFETSSANDVYVVAVSNTTVNNGVDNVGDYSSSTTTTLLSMLDDAETFDDFKNICALRPDANDINVYATSLTMSGWYAEESPSTSNKVLASTMPTINIAPGNNTFSGAIYLRRLISYNKFIIVPGKYITLTLNNWKVCNIPAGSYVLEQDDNVGDNYNGTESFYNNSNISHVFTVTKNDAGETGKYFEFYQMENKHNAVKYNGDATDHVGIDENAADWYTEREREFKTDNSGKDVNTGVYKSLVASNDATDPNNNASYVVINASIDYYVKAPADGETFDPTTAEPVDPNDATIKKIHRMAVVDYTIHLGYCENKSGDDPTVQTAEDFNCRRNSKYTYNVKINGVKNVVVD
jgi:hypothetical protein